MRSPGACLVVFVLAACIENDLFGPGKEDTSVGRDTPPIEDSAAPPVESCNGLDDDGDGEVDEGFADDDQNGRADCLDGECDLDPGAAGTCLQDAACVVVDPIVDPWSVVELWRFGAPAAAPDAVSSITQPLIVPLDEAEGMEVVTAVYDAAGMGWLVVIDGATGAERWAVSPVSAKTQIAAAEDGWHALVADVDGDGAAEVIADTMVLDGQTGEVRATLPVDTLTHQHRAPTVGDVDGDGSVEIVVAGRVFDANGTELWYSGEGVEDGVWSALVQLDADADAELITLGANLVLSDTDGTTLTRSPTFARNGSGGPCVGDFDGDGQPEFAYGAYDGLYVRDMDVRTVWYSPIDVANHAGQAACAGYDLDADGALEVLYADEHAFRIYDGRTGAVHFADDVNVESAATYASPALGDLDGDGAVEVVVVSSDPELGTSVIAYTHGGEGWPAVTTAWPVMDYDVWNVEADGSVPTTPAAAWLNGNGVRTAPVNPRWAEGADLVVTVNDVCLWDCVYGPVQLAAQVSNPGLVDAPAGATLAVYAVDGESRRPVASSRLGAIAAGETSAGVVFDLAPGDVGTEGFVVVVDDAGVLAECDEANNEASWTTGCPD